MQATIVYIIDPETHEVLLAKKLKKIGVGFWFGYGGKLEPGETAEECICRETFKESGDVIRLDPAKLEPIVHMSFYNNVDPKVEPASFEVLCYRIYVSKAEIGTPITTDEMAHPKWFPVLRLPWHEMKPGDELFVPQIIFGTTPIKGSIQFSGPLKEVVWSLFMPCTKEELTLSKAA